MSTTIVALGGGGFSMSETGESAIDDWLLERAAGTSSELPKVGFVPTASGDSHDYCERFEDSFAGRADTHVLSLFGQSPWGYTAPSLLLDMDLIYVGGGSTANLLTLWRYHGVDEIMLRAAAEGTILAGVSAGANCWFEASSTDSFGALAPLDDGLGFVPGSACPHYHGEAGRAESFRDWISTGLLPGPGIAIDDHAAVVFEDSAAVSVLVERPEARAYVVDPGGETLVAAEPDIRRLDRV